MNNKQVLESCTVLDIHDFKKGLNRAKNGYENSAGTWDGLLYFINRIEGEVWLSIEDSKQHILMSEKDIRFGTRYFLTCECGRLVNKLYLPLDGKKYICRHCVQRPYELTTINRHSKHGELLYRTNRMIKLSKVRGRVKRMFHNGSFTKGFTRYLHMCDKAGFKNEVTEANKLLSAVSG